MLDTTPWVERLRERATVLDGQVFGAAEVVSVLSTHKRLPVAFVYPVSDAAQPPASAVQSLPVQTVASTVGILIAVRNITDTTGGAALDALKPLREAVCAALLGWRPSDAAGVVAYAGGQMGSWDDGLLLWEDRYATQYRLQNMNQNGT